MAECGGSDQREQGRFVRPDDFSQPYRPIVRVLTVAERVWTERTLCAGNMGQQFVFAPRLPTAGLPLVLLVQIGLPKSFAVKSHAVVVRAEDADGRPMRPDPLFTAPWTPPSVTHDIEEETNIEFATPLSSLQLSHPGMIFFRIFLDDEPLAALPFRIRQMPPQLETRSRTLLGPQQ